jgi:DNA recombination protein RmuC
VRQLSSKAYWAQFERSRISIVLFIPGDQFLTAAVAEIQPARDAIRQDVIIATPTSFVALLKAVAIGWRQNVLADNGSGSMNWPRTLQATCNLQCASGRVGRTLGQSVDAYNSAWVPRASGAAGARKFTEPG